MIPARRTPRAGLPSGDQRPANGSGVAVRPARPAGGAAFDASTPGAIGDLDSSIISEAAPSEMAEFSETRLAPTPTPPPPRLRLPLIGKRPLGRAAAHPRRHDRRSACVGLVAVTRAARSTRRTSGSAQVGASGQALMQSQRLAKSVSQALVGSPQAFPEVRGKRRGAGAQRARPEDRRRRRCPPRRLACRTRSTPLMPLVDRAEKNAEHRASPSRRC